MPYALLFALVVSLSLHLAVLFGADIDFFSPRETKAGSPTLLAELKAPAPRALAPQAPPPSAVAKKVSPKRAEPRHKNAQPVATTPVISTPAASSSTVAPGMAAPPPAAALPAPEPEAVPASAVSQDSDLPAAASRLPANGTIDYRVDRGDSNFAIGVARHQWEIEGDHYRLTSMVQSTGIVWLFKDFRVEMESRGRITANGLRPDFFVLRRNDKPTREKAFFDWERMKVRVGDKGDQDLDAGAQDFLSFNYQLGFLPDFGAGSVLPIATGRKYAPYRLEVLGNEDIEIPAGKLHTLHLRAPGDNTTELWLAYDYFLLPVKIRHIDSKGDSLVQVATQIQTSPP